MKEIWRAITPLSALAERPGQGALRGQFTYSARNSQGSVLALFRTWLY